MIYNDMPLIKNKNLCKYIKKTILQMIAFFYIDRLTERIVPDDKILVIAGSIYGHPEE